jgi:hypothetical protein
MDTGTILIGFLFFALFIGVYALYRLLSDPPPQLDDRSVRIARFLGQPKFLDPIFAKPLTKREKIGWLIYLLILVLGLLFTQFTGLGAGRHWP